ncbi:amino acid adenylation domain-containing protein [Streptomyces sp. NPDC086023]|uniref:amino acid adenylation domain-containing protein n=1 Tax=Streptomyces sp. NPDC086023 TaxID=3365746 RepID=UPI0037CD8436
MTQQIRQSEAGTSLAELVARQAAVTPEATAVIAADGSTLDYAALDARANRLAHRLGRLGVRPDTVVGIHLERSPELVVAVLAVWKAGAAYLPLDPAHPAARLASLVEEVRPVLVLTAGRSAGTEPGAPQLDLDAERELVDALPGTAPEVAAHPGHLAYVIHTSGSTGRPKGVQVTQAGIANRVMWTVRTHGLGADDRVLHKTAIGFDAHNWEIFAPLVSGGSVALAPVGAERDPAALVAAARDLGATVLQVVPSVLRLLVAEPAWRELTSLRLLFSAGEPLHAELCRRALDAAGREDLAIWNTYGPTECSIDVTAQPYDPAQTAGPVPIGRPLPRTRLLVLDDRGKPVPVGVPGELFIGGAGLARGYLGRPDLTAERFVPDPYGPEGGRLYRTGDLVRWRADRTLEYRGRADHQVKVNGVRIEPGEVEAALLAHPEVTGAVVTAPETRDGTKRLTAHLTTADARIPADLRSFLRGRLPEALVPTVLVPLAEFPLTPNGKLDRAALPAAAAEEADRPYVAPRTAAEEIVAQVWRRLLNIERAGVQDDFFRLGGDSLMITRLAAGLREATDKDVSPASLFTSATVEQQAALLTRAGVRPPLVPVDREGPLPLSFGQRRLHFLDRMNPGGAEWVSPLILPLPEGADTALVQRALDALEERHEALRTRYPADADTAGQRIAAPGPVELAEAVTAREGLGALGAAHFARGFDLAEGPLWRALLVRVEDGHPVLVIAMHHLSCDGWSSAILEREFGELYAAYAEGREPELLPLELGYADFAAWQRTALTEDALAADLDHWREALDGHKPLALPTDHPRPAERDHKGAVVPVVVPAATADALAELGREHGATPFMTLLTGYVTLLARHSGEWDVTVGTPVAGRTRPETGDLVGFFLNSLAVRCGLTGDLTFAEALDRVRTVTLEAFAHQEVPFERVVEDVQGDRDLSRTPVYQAAFDLHDETLTTGGADLDDLETFREAWRIAKTDLTLFLRRRPDGTLAGVLEYATSLFEDATVRRLADHLVRLLGDAAARPDTRLADLDLSGAEERRRQLVEWNAGAGTTVAEPADVTVLELFEARAAERPAATALRHAGESVTFRELDAQANRFAHRLRQSGTTTEHLVGVLLDRGPDLVAAFLGSWKTGAGYVPLDPASPAERSAAMLTDSGVRVLVTTAEHAAAMAPFFPGELVVVDRDRALIDALPDTAPERRLDPEVIAYTIFTSGSTGRPKGVAVPHRGLANHVAWAARDLIGGHGGGAALFSSTAFDLVVPNVYAPLVAGVPLHLLPAGLDLADLGRTLAAGAPYSFVKLTPGHLDILSQQLGDEQAAALARTVLVAGEAFPGEAASRWLELLGPGRLVNEYGPTECSVGTCIQPVDAPVTGVVPIGRPLPGMAMYVLDDALRPVPLGAVGELYVGGTGVARGYTGRPGLTAERFLPDPYGPAGARLYRTGDLARQLPDGAVSFLGRIDHQIKVRGYRVEAGEIQAVLTAHPAVRDAAITADKGLTAYLVPAGAALPDHGELTRHCARLLPDYMLPSAYVALDAIPLTANGKLDRAALPDPAAARAEDTGTGPAGPRDIVEEHIAGIWQELLGTDPDIHDDFFQSGGNSILGIRLISQIQAEFAVSLPLRAIFESPTVAGLARAVEALVQAEIQNASQAGPATTEDLSDSSQSSHTSQPKEHQA